MNNKRIFSSLSKAPADYRLNFYSMYADIAFWGILNSSTLAFLAIYATHIGATTVEIGWINAAPAIISIFFSLPFGSWMESIPKLRALKITAVLSRLYFLPLIFIPIGLPKELQIFLIIAIVFLMNIPGAGLMVAFNSVFAEAIPIEWRGYVSGIRNGFFALVSIVVSVICGEILNRVSFPLGYILVFAFGFFGAVMSTLTFWFVKPVEVLDKQTANSNALSQLALKKIKLLQSPFQVYWERYRARLHIEALTGSFRKVLFLMLIFNIAQYLIIPIFPVYTVNILGIPDGIISLGNAIFNIALFAGSTQIARLVMKIGNQRVTGLGLVFMAGYPVILAIAANSYVFLAAFIFGGFGWSLASGAMYNFVLEEAVPEARSSYLGWYNLIANMGILMGSLLGPVFGDWFGLQPTLFVGAVVRVIVGLVLLRWV